VLTRIRSWCEGIELERAGYRNCGREEEDAVSAEEEKILVGVGGEKEPSANR